MSVSHLQVCERLALGVNCLPGVLQCLILEGEEGGGGGGNVKHKIQATEIECKGIKSREIDCSPKF